MEKTDSTSKWRFGKEHSQEYIINLYSLIALFAATIFGALHFLNLFVDVNTTVGAIEIGVGITVLLNMIGLRLHGNVAIARNILLGAVLTLMQVLLISGGTQNTGVFWLFAFPVATLFLAGKKQGTWWIAALYAVIIGTVLGAQFSLFSIPYSIREIYQLIISLSVVTLGVYIYQDSRESALRESEASHQDLQEFLDQMPTYNIKVGLDGIITFANKQAKQTSGLGEDMLGSKFLDARAWTSNEDARKKTEAAFHEAAAGRTVSYDEKVLADSPEGPKQLTVNFTLQPVFQDDNLQYILVEARDVTPEREAARTKNEFVSIVTERLRPSLTAISEATHELRSPSAAVPDELKESIQKIHENSLQIKGVVNTMLLVSGLELGNLPVQPQKLNIGMVCDSVVEAIRMVYLKDRKLEIEEYYDDKIPEIPVDFELISTIIHALLINAIKFTPDDGHINIRASQVEQRLTAESKGSVQIEIQDNGRGIPEDEQKLIFTKFFRSNDIQDQIGPDQSLYIVKRLIDYLGGSITFMSKENVGTIFVIMLPLEGMKANKNNS